MSDPIAYVPAEAGVMLCPACALRAAGSVEALEADDEYGRPAFWAVFCDSETDAPSHCDTCGAYLPEALTAEGEAYVSEALAVWIATGHGRPDVLDQWADALEAHGASDDAYLAAYRRARAE